MKFLDFQDNLFVSVVVFNFPSSEIEGNDFLCRGFLLIIKVSQQDGGGPIGADQSDDLGQRPFVTGWKKRFMAPKGPTDGSSAARGVKPVEERRFLAPFLHGAWKLTMRIKE